MAISGKTIVSINVESDTPELMVEQLEELARKVKARQSQKQTKVTGGNWGFADAASDGKGNHCSIRFHMEVKE